MLKFLVIFTRKNMIYSSIDKNISSKNSVFFAFIFAIPGKMFDIKPNLKAHVQFTICV